MVDKKPAGPIDVIRHPGVGIAGVLILAGTFLPWVKVGSGLFAGGVSGWDSGGGVFTLAVGIVLVFLAIAPERLAVIVLGAVASIGGGFVAVQDAMTAYASLAVSGIGIGVYAIAIGAVIGLFTSLTAE